MRALLVSTYDLGRQPRGLAVPASALREVGVEVRCADISREPFDDAWLEGVDLVGFYLPMHTATRLAGPLIDRIRRTRPAAKLAAYGLYAPLNRDWLRQQGVHHVLGPEAATDLATLAAGEPVADYSPGARAIRRPTVGPDRSGLLPLTRYAGLQMPDGTRRVVGNTDATHGCKHLCRHCPVVPVYHGRFAAIPLDVVLDDVRAQVNAGAEHITFGDPDFFNGPTHARRLVEQLAAAHPGVTYDATIKIEHILAHADLLPVLAATGCLFITSAVESVDDVVLERLRKGHTKADFERAVDLTRAAGLALSPTFVPFTPWTTLDGYVDLLATIRRLDLVEAVAPIQLAIRLLVTAQSALLELPDLVRSLAPFDATSLTWPWQHAEPRVDQLQQHVMALVSARAGEPRPVLFEAIEALAGATSVPGTPATRMAPPYLTEGWYCCAEPGPEQLDTL
ncbi:MAG TPA: CUAEP/CCAEP-tail radical SAM protein [Candidatus Limnocylindria bacterium]